MTKENVDVDEFGITYQEAVNMGLQQYEKLYRQLRIMHGACVAPDPPKAEPVPYSAMEQLPPEGKHDVRVLNKSYVQGTADSTSYWLFTCETIDDRIPVNFITYRDIKNAVGEVYQVKIEHRGGGKYHARFKI